MITNKMKYNYDLLVSFCKENNITLTKDYSIEKVNRETKIEGKCIFENCNNEFNKTHRMLLYSNGYCNFHTENQRQNNRKKTCLEKYGFDNPLKMKKLKKK